ncbi:MAG: glycosyltransferase family 2 protein [Minisyncoccia bacterium]
MSSSPANKSLSIVIPAFNEEGNIEPIYKAVARVLEEDLSSYTATIIFVDDGSSDGTASKIHALAQEDARVSLIGLSRNFGKEVALTAGIHAATGDAIVTLDADLQHPPQVIASLVRSWEEGNEVVIGIRTKEGGEPILRQAGSHLFSFFMRRLSEVPSVRGASDFRLIDRKVAEAFKQFGEHRRITRGLIDWLGFRRVFVAFVAPERVRGAVRYSYPKLFGLAFSAIVAHSFFPLRLVGYLGIIITPLAMALGLFVIVEQPILGDPLGLEVSGTAMIAIFILFLVGIILISLGLMALYIEGIKSEVTGRPLYVVRETVNAASGRS